MRKQVFIFYSLMFLLNYLVFLAVGRFLIKCIPTKVCIKCVPSKVSSQFLKCDHSAGNKSYRKGLLFMFIISEQLDLIVSKN